MTSIVQMKTASAANRENQSKSFGESSKSRLLNEAQNCWARALEGDADALAASASNPQQRMNAAAFPRPASMALVPFPFVERILQRHTHPGQLQRARKAPQKGESTASSPFKSV
jgi:hypothetical protein